MKQIWLTVAILGATALLWAQDDAPNGTFGGGGGGAQVFTRVDAVNPMDQVKSFLSKANISLTSDQEKTLRPTVEAAIKQLRDINDRFAAASGRGADAVKDKTGSGVAQVVNVEAEKRAVWLLSLMVRRPKK